MYKKISFCTVSMNRTHHILSTLQKNIEDNIDYPNIEFVLLDYNSKDGLEELISSSFMIYVEKGVLVYFKTFAPCYFHRSHSRNLVFKLANGDILCNIDADNFTGKGFAFFINEKFGDSENRFLSTANINKNLFGRICVPRDKFLAVTGYDESMSDYGFEDIDMINRLQLSGLEKYLINEPEFLKAIDHKDSERIKNEMRSNILEAILVSHINYFSSQLLFLFQDGTYAFGTIIDNFSKEASYKYNELI